MITVYRKGDFDRYYIATVCDQCHQLIEDVKQGNYHWIDTGRGKDTADHFFPFVTLHKACNRLYEHLHPAPEGLLWYWEELRMLPIFLGNNLQMDWEQMRQDGRLKIPSGPTHWGQPESKKGGN